MRAGSSAGWRRPRLPTWRLASADIPMIRSATEAFNAIAGGRRPRGLAAGALAALGILASGCGALIPSAPGTVLFQDDFTRSSTGWDTFEEPGYRADYVH